MKNTFEEIKNTFRRGSMLTKLIYINVATFLAVFFISLFFPNIAVYVSVPGSLDLLLRRPWTLLTYMFVHEGFWHILMNMLWLYWFGKMFLTYFTGKQMSAVYLLGGFAGALFHILINYFLPAGRQAMILGASAAVMSVVFGVIAYKPDYIINLLFIGPVKIKYIGIVAFLLDLTGLVGNMKIGAAASDGIAHTAHLGGAFFGLWFGYAMRNGKDITRSFNNFLNGIFMLFSSDKKSKMKISRRDKFSRSKPKSDWEYNKTKADNQKETDRILDKISKKGYDSLTKKEKEFLFRQKKD